MRSLLLTLSVFAATTFAIKLESETGCDYDPGLDGGLSMIEEDMIF